jgi:hypothetical protein
MLLVTFGKTVCCVRDFSINQLVIMSQTAALLLTYVHHYTCKFLPMRLMNGRRLKTLSTRPNNTLPTARKHPLLAAHLTLPYTAKPPDTRSVRWTYTLARLCPSHNSTGPKNGRIY